MVRNLLEWLGSSFIWIQEMILRVEHKTTNENKPRDRIKMIVVRNFNISKGIYEKDLFLNYRAFMIFFLLIVNILKKPMLIKYYEKAYYVMWAYEHIGNSLGWSSVSYFYIYLEQLTLNRYLFYVCPLPEKVTNSHSYFRIDID